MEGTTIRTVAELIYKRNFVPYLSKAIFFVSRHVLIIGDVRRLSTSLLFGVMDPSVKRSMCWEISKRSVVTNLSSWLISISSAQPSASVGTGPHFKRQTTSALQCKTQHTLLANRGGSQFVVFCTQSCNYI